MSRRRRTAIFVAIIVTLFVACLHVVAASHAGGLWRDEVNGVNTAALPTIADIFHHLPYESFPMLWPLLLRAWVSVFGDGDMMLRVLCLVLGLVSLAAIWASVRMMGATAPLFTLGLFALNPEVVRYGDSLRAFGLGASLLLLALAFMWRICNEPTRRNAILGGIVMFLCAHCVYYNGLFLLAGALAATVICVKRGRYKPIGIIVAIGVITAISGLPYLLTISERSGFNDLLRAPFFGWRDLFVAVRATLDRAGDAMVLLWGVGLFGVLFVAVRRLRRRRQQSEAVVFSAMTLIISLGAFAGFLVWLRYPAWGTYFIAPMAVAALGMDVAASAVLRGRSTWAQPALLVLLVVLSSQAAWAAAHVRMTNVDVVAATLSPQVTADDLVIVTHWTTAIGFERYYSGAAPWQSLPALADHRVHRYDLLRKRMAEKDATADVLTAMGHTLKRGGMVFLVRRTTPWPHGRDPVLLDPAPHPVTGWSAAPYLMAWKSQLDYLVWQFAREAGDVRLPDVGAVQPHEQMWVAVLRGWREPQADE